MATSIVQTDTAASKGEQRRVVILACCAFFLRFVALGAFAPYVFFWLEHNGHDTYSRSVLGTISRLPSFVAPLFWGSFADWSGRHRLVYFVGTVLNACGVALLTLFPQNFWWQAVRSRVLRSE